MGGFEQLADGRHVDDAGNLICSTYVDFRDPAERFPITVLRRASSERHAIAGCETIRISRSLPPNQLGHASTSCPTAVKTISPLGVTRRCP